MKLNTRITSVLLVLALLTVALVGGYWQSTKEPALRSSALEPEFEELQTELFVGNRFQRRLYEKYPDIDEWVRPEGPLRVGLQAGHWKNAELPDELERLRGTSLGTSGGGTTEVAVNLAIAELTAELLEAKGFAVDVLPATIPPGYYADTFVAIHADGSSDPNTSGFKATGPRRDYSEHADTLNQLFYDLYPVQTALGIDDNITRNMRGYYAFNWWRYDHALHPKTPAVILETGFLTSPHDQRVLIGNQQLAAEAIAEVVVRFLERDEKHL